MDFIHDKAFLGSPGRKKSPWSVIAMSPDFIVPQPSSRQSSRWDETPGAALPVPTNPPRNADERNLP